MRESGGDQFVRTVAVALSPQPASKTRPLSRRRMLLSPRHRAAPLPRYTNIYQQERPHQRRKPRASEVAPSRQVPEPRINPIVRRATCAYQCRNIHGITSQVAHEKRLVDLHVGRDAWSNGFDEGEQDVERHEMGRDMACGLRHGVGGVDRKSVV